MKNQSKNYGRFESYMHSTMNDDEQTRFESELLNSKKLSKEFEKFKYNKFEAYIHNEMDNDEREKFEYMLSNLGDVNEEFTKFKAALDAINDFPKPIAMAHVIRVVDDVKKEYRLRIEAYINDNLDIIEKGRFEKEITENAYLAKKFECISGLSFAEFKKEKIPPALQGNHNRDRVSSGISNVLKNIKVGIILATTKISTKNQSHTNLYPVGNTLTAELDNTTQYNHIKPFLRHAIAASILLTIGLSISNLDFKTFNNTPVAIIDSEVDFWHECTPKNTEVDITNENNPHDSNGHGTDIATIIHQDRDKNSVVYAEYFIDFDPGVGNGEAIILDNERKKEKNIVEKSERSSVVLVKGKKSERIIPESKEDEDIREIAHPNNSESNLNQENEDVSELPKKSVRTLIVEDNSKSKKKEFHPTRYRDSLALVALYNATNGVNWTISWDLNQTLDSWYGIGINEYGRVISLDLSYNELIGIIPFEIENLTELVVLNFEGNQLNGTIPNKVGNLKQLVKLSLGSNTLEGSIPSEIGSLSELTTLYLFSNQLIGNIPPELGNLSNLAYLSLSSNQLSGSIPPEIGNLTNLNNLNLSNNQLSGSYNFNLLIFCEMSNMGNEHVSNENNFDATWEDFCTTGDSSIKTEKHLDITLNKIYGNFKIYLEGAYDNTTEHKMRTSLNMRYLLTRKSYQDSILNHDIAIQPYDDIPAYYQGDESVSGSSQNYPSDVVDWIFVSVRDETIPDTELNRTAAWLLDNGNLQLLRPLLNDIHNAPDSVFVVVEHRNNLGTMFSTKIPTNRKVITWGFTTQDEYRTSTTIRQTEPQPDVWIVVASNSQQNNINSYINRGDKVILDNDNGQYPLYLPVDYNLNGEVNGDDKAIFNKNNGQFLNVPK